MSAKKLIFHWKKQVTCDTGEIFTTSNGIKVCKWLDFNEVWTTSYYHLTENQITVLYSDDLYARDSDGKMYGQVLLTDLIDYTPYKVKVTKV